MLSDPHVAVMMLGIFILVINGLSLLLAAWIAGDLFNIEGLGPAILAWLAFGILLWGRWRYGWRGSVAVRLTLAGIVLLLLSYFGSKFVLETLLGRSWQS